ncbi:MAG: hypothetical protein ABIK09_18470 [Pseudomonadota bacterium]
MKTDDKNVACKVRALLGLPVIEDDLMEGDPGVSPEHEPGGSEEVVGDGPVQAAGMGSGLPRRPGEPSAPRVRDTARQDGVGDPAVLGRKLSRADVIPIGGRLYTRRMIEERVLQELG